MAKPIVITDDSVVNSYGFRVLTGGVDLTLYKKNPILLYDHARRSYENDQEIILPIGKMTDIQMRGNQIVATPEFDEQDKFAAEIARKYEKDILNMASIGFDAIEWSEDPALMLPGQKGPTVTKWQLKEVSITDIGANQNCTKLSHNGRTLVLSEGIAQDEIDNFFQLNKPNNPTMKKVIAALNGSKLVTLNEASTEELVAASVETLVSQLSAKDATLSQKDAEIQRLKDEAAAAKTAALKDKATSLVESALSAKKIVAAQKEKFVNLASKDEEGFTMVKEMLDSLQAYQPVVPQLKDGITVPESTSERVALFDKHAKEGTLHLLGEENIKLCWKAKHGSEIKSETLKALAQPK